MTTTQENKLIQTQFEHAAMVTQLAKPGHTILQSLDPRKCHLLHMCIGIVGEVFELVEALELSATSGNRVDIVEEMGDIEFYLQGALQSEYMQLKVLYADLGISRQEALEANLNKLLVGPNARYKEGTYSNEQAVGRADKDGADA